MIQPQGSFYFCERLLAIPESDTIVIPGADEDLTYDCLVIAAGEGRLNDDGARATMQACVGDRVIVEPRHFWEWQGEDEEWVTCEECRPWRYEFPDDDCPRCNTAAEVLVKNGGFVSNSDLIAIIPGPDHSEILPAGDWVLVEPDKLYHQDEGAIVQARPSGVLVASHALHGGEEWAKQEGWVRYQESCRLWDSPAWQAEPEYPFRHRRLHNWIDGLHPDVRRWALQYGREEQEDPGKSRRMWVRKEVPTRGRVVKLGPGLIRSDGERWLGAWYREDNGLTLGLWPGDVVYWQAAHTGLLLSVAGRQLLALKADVLMAVEVG